MEESVCPLCLGPIDAEQTNCTKCHAPFASCTTPGPYEQVRSQSHAARAGVPRPDNVLLLFGMWLILAPTMLIAFISAAVLAFGVIDGLERHTTTRYVGLAISGSWVLLAMTILWMSTRKYLRATQQD